MDGGEPLAAAALSGCWYLASDRCSWYIEMSSYLYKPLTLHPDPCRTSGTRRARRRTSGRTRRRSCRLWITWTPSSTLRTPSPRCRRSCPRASRCNPPSPASWSQHGGGPEEALSQHKCINEQARGYA